LFLVSPFFSVFWSSAGIKNILAVSEDPTWWVIDHSIAAAGVYQNIIYSKSKLEFVDNSKCLKRADKMSRILNILV